MTENKEQAKAYIRNIHAFANNLYIDCEKALYHLPWEEVEITDSVLEKLKEISDSLWDLDVETDIDWLIRKGE